MRGGARIFIIFTTKFWLFVTNFWKRKLLKIRKQGFHMQNKSSLLFSEILTNTNTNKCCQMFLTFLKRY